MAKKDHGPSPFFVKIRSEKIALSYPGPNFDLKATLPDVVIKNYPNTKHNHRCVKEGRWSDLQSVNLLKPKFQPGTNILMLE